MRSAALAFCALLAVVVAGCGGSSSSSSSSGKAPATNTSSSSGGASAGGVTIDMKNIQFVPRDQKVKVGEKVTWSNTDAVDHNVTAKSGASFKSSTIAQGATFSFTPTAAGTIKYLCTIHPGMDGTLTVTQ